MNFLDSFSKNARISNYMKILPLVVELFHVEGRTDRQTDVTKLVFAFRNSANAPKNDPLSTFDFKIILLTVVIFACDCVL